MNYRLRETLEFLLNGVLLIGIFIGIALGIEINYILFSISIISGILLILFQRKKKQDHIEGEKDKLKEKWGKEQKEKRDFVSIKNLYKFLIVREKPSFYIDDITWIDLNMDSVFHKVDHTKSLAGMQYLYNILRKPIFNKDTLENRNQVINSLITNKEISQSIQYPLSKLGKKEGKNIFLYFENGINIETKILPLYIILSYLPYIALISFFIDTNKAFIFLLIIITVNSILYQRNKNRIYGEVETFRYLGSLIRCAENIIKIDKKDIDLNQDEMENLLKDIRQVIKNISKINFNENLSSEAEVLVHYYNMIMLKEPKVFYKTINLLNKHREGLFEIYEIIGKVDSYISIASYKDSLNYFCEPQFIDDSSIFYLKSEELYHPLLDNPISYSLELDNRGALVTGSNASGKSTFLRTIGINAIFAQTLNLVLGRTYISSYFMILTSIGATDSIVKGDSYFMAEAKSLKRILDSIDLNKPVLCILDEIFRGTNTGERISAATASLNYMIERNTCVIAATHDLELTNLVNTKYNNYHFKETIEKNDMKFDYILRSGACTSRNAITILDHLGYPREIYEKAQVQAKEYLLKE